MSMYMDYWFETLGKANNIIKAKVHGAFEIVGPDFRSRLAEVAPELLAECDRLYDETGEIMKSEGDFELFKIKTIEYFKVYIQMFVKYGAAPVHVDKAPVVSMDGVTRPAGVVPEQARLL